MHRDLIRPLGRTLLHGEAGKPTRAVGLLSPKGVPWRGQRGDLRATGGGNGRSGGARRGGFGGGRGNLRAFGRRTVGGSGRGRAKKPHTRGLPGSRGCARVPGARAKHGASRAIFRGAPGENRASPGKKRRLGGLKGAGTAGIGGKKPLFAAKRAGNGAVLGRKLAEKACGACRVIWTCSGNLRELSAKKGWVWQKPFHAHIGRNPVSPLFLVDGAPSLGRVIWWIGRVAIQAEKSDECVTPRGTPRGKRKRR